MEERRSRRILAANQTKSGPPTQDHPTSGPLKLDDGTQPHLAFATGDRHGSLETVGWHGTIRQETDRE